jgi:hypothetical protein
MQVRWLGGGRVAGRQVAGHGRHQAAPGHARHAHQLTHHPSPCPTPLPPDVAFCCYMAGAASEAGPQAQVEAAVALLQAARLGGALRADVFELPARWATRPPARPPCPPPPPSLSASCARPACL